MSRDNKMGKIFDIQRFSLHDGSGIRTLVFFQGCFLRCRWCCNPESQQGSGKEISAAEVMAIIEKDRPYYRRSGGGVTLSGGEFLCQPDFALAILEAAKESGIHTAVESTALAEFHVIEKLLPYIDVYLMDIKHTDPSKHEQFTGRRNDLALANAAKIAAFDKKTELIVRVPVIPGFNASAHEIKAIADFAATLPNVREIHLLPYHRLGEGKYAKLGRDYPMGNTQPPTDTEMEFLKSQIHNLTCKIGG